MAIVRYTVWKRLNISVDISKIDGNLFHVLLVIYYFNS